MLTKVNYLHQKSEDGGGLDWWTGLYLDGGGLGCSLGQRIKKPLQPSSKTNFF